MVTSLAEEVTDERCPAKIVEALSKRKAQAVMTALEPARRKGHIVLGADTIVWLDHEALGKPGSREEAAGMIRALQGREHSVYTGVTLLRGDEETVTFHCETRVKIHDMDEAEIRAYIDSQEPYDKAGGYAVQGMFACFVDQITGDYNNVVGLPLSRVYRELKRMMACS